MLKPLSSLRLLVLLCVLLPLMAYVAVGAYRYGQIRAETEVRLDRSLRIAHEHALKVLDTAEALLERVGDVAAGPAAQVQASQQAVHEQLAAMARGKPQLQGIWVIGPDGKMLATSRFFPAPDLDVSDREYFRWHTTHDGGRYVSQPLVSRTTNEPFFDLSRRRRQPGSGFGGLVMISMLPAYFQELHADLAADEPGLAITMFREDGAIFSRWPPLKDAPPRLSPASPVMTRIAEQPTRGDASGVSSVDGRDRLLRYAKVGDYPIYLGTGMDVGEIRRRWLREMGWLAAFGLLPLAGLLLAARLALRRTRDALRSAEQLSEETMARRRVEEALLQAQKLEALGRLTGGVAHDFNNALMVISNNLFLLRRKHPELGGTQLESIGRAVGSATKLTRQLLAFSRRQALVPEHMRLQERLPGMADLLAPVLGSQVKLAVHVDPGTAPIRVDAAELELALINLAINARDAMPAGGSFHVSARDAGERRPPQLPEGPMVMVEAADTGTGIDEAVLDKVFEPFFTTKAVGEGTGLGLSQVWGLCQRAGGLATVESHKGAGTTVRLFFPAQPEEAGGPAPAPAAPDAPLGKRVLLVEDNDEVAAALQPVLETLGCTVTRLDRAASAREWLARQDRVPDVLLTDVVMPGEMDGVGLAQHARTQYPGLRVLLMTGYAEQMEAISRLGFDILPKPCSAAMLAEAIGRA